MANPTEFDLLKAAHRFLRDDTTDKPDSWDAQLAAKYYSRLYREFAVCDLKHYKSGRFALRWRTEDEVLAGTGEETCANSRCKHHGARARVPLTTLELPFAYEEAGVPQAALVKVVLCERCTGKLMWRRRHEAAAAAEEGAGRNGSRAGEAAGEGNVGAVVQVKKEEVEEEPRSSRRKRSRDADRDRPRRSRHSRSRSPVLRERHS